ncbi:MAG TPA: hypothetical protein VFE25_02170 [Opitutaceae bacterium]|jgi:uncharacterized membrane protein|nr:hypothetical protein [Opitutaceae bacterium]
MSPSNSDKLLAFGRACYGAGVAGLGILHFTVADFLPVMVPSVPAWTPARGLLPYVIGAALLAAGGAIALGKCARSCALALGFVLLSFLFLRDIPVQIATATVWPLAVWNNPLKLLALAGGAFAVAAAVPGLAITRMNMVYTAFGCLALAITCALFGFEHFQYPQFVAMLIPSWVPAHLFWTYFCGAALMAAGVGMILRIQARLAAGLLGSMIFVWFIVLHIPRALADPRSGKGNEVASVFEALAFAGIAFVLSQTLPRKPA